MKITINAGHDPIKDSGAVSPNRLREADVNNDIAQLVMYYLQQADYDVLVVQNDSLQAICDASNNYGADIFVSIHCNSAENKNAKGTETFAFLDGDKGYKLAECIQNQIVNSMETVDRGVKTNGFYVLRNTNCPAVLIECGFLSNTEDECMLASSDGKEGLSMAIARGITDYVAG